MIVVVCEIDHIEAVTVRAEEEEERQEMIRMLRSAPRMEELLSSYARTLMHDDVVLACFGVWPMWPGVGRAWSLISAAARKYPKALYSSVKRCLETIEARDDMHRIEATVRSGHPSAHSWIRHLGFQREGLMRNYGQFGIGDSHLYARITPWAQD